MRWADKVKVRASSCVILRSFCAAHIGLEAIPLDASNDVNICSIQWLNRKLVAFSVAISLLIQEAEVVPAEAWLQAENCLDFCGVEVL